MPDHRLLKSQKNDILILIKEAGLAPSEFDWEDIESVDDPGSLRTHQFNQLVHRPSGYAALFGTDYLAFSPGQETQNETEYKLNWVGKYLSVKRWLSYLRRELETPDLWASVAQEAELLSLEPADATNSPFTDEEMAQIKRAIEEIRTYITSTHELSDEPLRRVNDKLDYLIDASTRLGRIDWKNLFVGALISLAIQQLTPSGPSLRELFGAAGHLLRYLLGGIISPPLLH